jgi:urease accessory protein
VLTKSSPQHNASASDQSLVFAANRATGRVAFSVAAANGKTRRTDVYEDGSLRVRFPNSGAALDAVIVNTAGGMTGGDRFGISVAIGAGATANVTTAAAEKIYRSTGPDCSIAIGLEVEAGGSLAWLPQETILFDRVRLNRSIEIDVVSGARLVVVEAMVFGRGAMGEEISDGHVVDRWRLRVDGALAFAETLRLDGAIAEQLGQRAVAADGVAVASVLTYPADDAAVAAVRAIGDDCAGEIGISAWNGLALTRCVAGDGAALRRDLGRLVPALTGAVLPRLWQN